MPTVTHNVRPELAALLVPIDRLRPHPDNPNNGDTDAITKSLRRNGLYRPVVAWRQPDGSGVILAGNHTYAAAHALGWTHLAATWVDADNPDDARRIMLADNRYAQLARMDDGALADLLQSLDTLDGTGYTDPDLDELLTSIDRPLTLNAGGLAARFGWVPFSVLDARQGPWRDRKRQWLTLGITSADGRGDADLHKVPQAAPHINDPGFYQRKARAEERAARPITTAEYLEQHPPTKPRASIFDPVLTEILCRWYSAPGARVLDPFAGGSVRGIVTAHLGRHYTGIDVLAAQVEANREQARTVLDGQQDGTATWVHADADAALPQLPAGGYDLLLTCPPYYDLERYSDDPADLSTMTPADFEAAYNRILTAAVRCLAPDSFAVVVTGNVRTPAGHVLDLAGVTTRIMAAAGAPLATEAVYITPAGSLAVRAGRFFASTRALGRSHQQVLVYCKGDRRRAADRCGTVDVTAELAAAAADPRETEDP